MRQPAKLSNILDDIINLHLLQWKAFRANYYVHFVLKISFRAYSLMINSITRNLNKVTILTKQRSKNINFCQKIETKTQQ